MSDPIENRRDEPKLVQVTLERDGGPWIPVWDVPTPAPLAYRLPVDADPRVRK